MPTINRSWRFLLLLAVVSSVLIAAFVQHKEDFAGPRRHQFTANAYARDTADIPPLLLRTGECRTFLQTRSYWHENYTPGIVYYRPLSLTWFWCERQLFGTRYFDRWIIVSIVLHLMCCAILGCFIRSLTGSDAAALVSVLVYAGYRNFGSTTQALTTVGLSFDTPALVATTSWKDQPTLIADCLTLYALICVRNSRWSNGLLATLVAVFVKESGWMTYPLALALALYDKKASRIPARIYILAAICFAVPIAARYFSGMDLYVHHPQASLTSMFMRYSRAVSGYYFIGFLNSHWPATLLGSALYLIAVFRRIHPFIKLGAAMAAIAAAGFANSILNDVGFATGIVPFFDSTQELYYVIACFFFCACCAALQRERTLVPPCLILIVLSLIAALPDVAVIQPNDHVLHLCFAFQSAVAGISFVALLRRANSWQRHLHFRSVNSAGILSSALQ